MTMIEIPNAEGSRRYLPGYGRPKVGRAPTTACGVAPTHARGPSRGSIGAIIGAYKMAVTRLIGRTSYAIERVWQRNYDEHIIPDADEWNRIPLCIEGNPARWATDEENPACARI